MGEELIQRLQRDQAEVARSRRRPFRLGFKCVADLVNIDFQVAEYQRRGHSGTDLANESQRSFVEAQRGFERADGQNDVVETVDHEFSPALIAPRHGRRPYRLAPS